MSYVTMVIIGVLYCASRNSLRDVTFSEQTSHDGWNLRHTLRRGVAKRSLGRQCALDLIGAHSSISKSDAQHKQAMVPMT